MGHSARLNHKVWYITTMDYVRADSALYKLLKTGAHLKLPKGQVVHALDDNAKLNLIKSGFIKRYLITKDGSKGIQVIYGPDDIFPLTPVYKSIFNIDVYTGLEQYYYEAMTNIEIFSISQSTLKEASDRDPLINKDLLYAAGLRLNSYIHRLESMSLRVANMKVAHQLAYLANLYGKQTEDGIVIQLPLTHQNLADVLNLARETVTHCLTSLEKRGIISSGKYLVVADPDKLNKLIH